MKNKHICIATSILTSICMLALSGATLKAVGQCSSMVTHDTATRGDKPAVGSSAKSNNHGKFLSTPIAHDKQHAAQPASQPTTSTTPAAISQHSLGTGSRLADIGTAYAQLMDQSCDISDAGDRDLKSGNWDKAKQEYEQALTVWTDNYHALYGLGRCADHEGDVKTAIACYKRNIYTSDPNRYGSTPGDGYNENDPQYLMEFSVLLSKAGAVDEATKNYNRAISFVNYTDGRQTAPYLLPAFGQADNQIQYSSAMLQAMAHVAYALLSAQHGTNNELTEAHTAEAIEPNSPLAYAYEATFTFGRDRKQATALWVKAYNLDNRTGPMAQTVLAMMRACLGTSLTDIALQSN